MSKPKEFLQISGLQHIAFCKRRWGLVYLEQEWSENLLTAEGRSLHERVDAGYKEYRRGLRQYSGLYVNSIEHGIYGRTDLVEAIQGNGKEHKISILDLTGKWILYPVEFKRGKPRVPNADLIQLCAQALCLEEMTGTEVPEGAVFYWEIRKRLEVKFDKELRKATLDLIELAHKLSEKGELPEAKFGKHCKNCSMLEICMPKSCEQNRVELYKKELLG